MEQFPDEESCLTDLRNVREKQGVVCKKCTGKKQYWLKAKGQWQCADCGFGTTLRSGTMMENSKLSVRTWYIAMAFMTYSKKGVSAVELQRQLGHKRYDTVWSPMHRIREAMGKRDALYGLKGEIGFDEGYFEIAAKESVKKNLKRGRGSQKQSNVAVMAESTPLEDPDSGKKSSHCRYFKMKVLTSHKAGEIDETVEGNFDETSIVFSDKSTSYVNISDYVEMHIMEKFGKETTATTLKWVHIANAKRTLLGIYHKIKGKYLQNYLDEFCYRLNRRYFGERLFDRLTIAITTPYWYING